MRSVQTASRRARPWIGPLAALLFSLGLILLPVASKVGLAWVLERSVFYPFRFAVGWGPGSLATRVELFRMGRELADRRWNQDEALEVQAENARLRRMLGLRRRTGLDFLPAAVVGGGRSRLGEVLLVQPHRLGDVVPGMAVIGPEGLLGRVGSRLDPWVRVECLNSIEVAVSVLDQRSREGGILKWKPERGDALFIEGIPGQADWQPGDRLVTSGLGAAFPRGLLVGWVEGLVPQRGGILKAARIRPAAVPARAEEVFILLVPPTATGGAQEGPDLSGLYPAEAAGRLRRGGSGGIVLDAGVVPVP